MKDVRVHVKHTREDDWDKHPVDSYDSVDHAKKLQIALLQTNWGVSVSEYTPAGLPVTEDTKFQDGTHIHTVDYHPGEKTCPIHKIEYRSQHGMARPDGRLHMDNIYGICDLCITESTKRS